MLKKNSIFFRILIPVTIIMLLQALLIGLVLFANGTVKSLEDSSVENLRKNAENRGITLENAMVHSWSNIDKLETDVKEAVESYLNENGITLDDALQSGSRKTEMLSLLSGPVIDALRLTSSTGAYIYFVDGAQTDAEGRLVCSGLYYRDLDPVSTPADYSDILFLRGDVNIARKDMIQLDGLWSESFTLSPEQASIWREFSYVRDAAEDFPELPSADLSYWNEPHLMAQNAIMDSNRCITYARPVVIDGRIAAVIGTEIQVEQIVKYFPASDFGSTGQGGYMLVVYDKADEAAPLIDCKVYAVTGSYIGRMVWREAEFTLQADDRFGAYTFADGAFEGARVILHPLRLYNTNAPFSGEQWALASIGTDNMLFTSSRSVTRGVVYSTVISFLAGIALLAFVIRYSTKPLLNIVGQIEKGGADDPVVSMKKETYEIELLCSTINTMKDKRRSAEMELREERERYLMALESAADTFVEYDIAQEAFMVYYFSDENRLSALSSEVFDSFAEKVKSGAVCHGDDIDRFLEFLNGRTPEPVEVRIRAGKYIRVTGVESDDGFYWFLFKASHIYDNDGSLRKVIGIARQITQEKLSELARLEAGRRDATTGFYNRDYGVDLIKKSIFSARESESTFSLCVIRAENFDMFEAHYGRVFGAAVLMELSFKILSCAGARDIAVRLGNDEFMLFFSGAGWRETEAALSCIFKGIESIYAGENPDLRLRLSAGAAMPEDAWDYDRLSVCAFRALQYAGETDGGGRAYYGDIPASAKQAPPVFHGKPVSVSMSVSREEIVGFAFDIFERTTDTKSVVNILLGILGRVFSLSQAVVCSYDADFGANKVLSQWNCEASSARGDGIDKISHADFAAFERMLDDNGTLLYSGEAVADCPEGVLQLLCALPDERLRALCCEMYENDVHTGRMLFKLKEPGRTWTPEEIYSLHEITKIVSAHLSIEKSNTASKAKSEFLSKMSHEIRTPMNAIIGMTRIARDSMGDRERLSSSLGKIDFSAKHLLALINDVLDMSRIESGKMQIKNEPFSLDTFVENLDTLMRPPFDAKGISFVIKHEAARVNVVGDEYRLRQVLVNLLGNACKFTDAGGTVMFSVEEVNGGGAEADGFGHFRFSVRDTGIGISLEDQPNIFNAFEQAKSPAASTRQREGTGLGLSISTSIIGAMGGRIELESKPGEGSDFFFTLKMELCDSGGEASESEAASVDYEKIFAGKKILLVEDNEINIEIAAYLLEAVGFAVDVAKNGREAVDMFLLSAQGRYDAILMDIQMPVMDGLDATREIRRNGARPDARTMPIIAMTANAFDEDMKKSIESGMNGHIAKPIDGDKLFALLEKLIR